VRLWQLLSAYRSMVLAVVALAALMLIVATSARWVRRCMRYESWHLLHLYAYLGIGLAVPHELLLGSDFRGPAARLAGWSTSGVAPGRLHRERFAW
jgi:DMSO/TMAO reductase YedYZ heme-binding membrane subunit